MALIPGADPLLILAAILVVGVAFGALARRVRLPAVTGQIIAGVLLGRIGFQVFSPESVRDLEPLTHFALGLMAVTVGAHLNFRRLRNAGRRLFLLLLLESVLVPGLVFAGLIWLPGMHWTTALLFGALGVSTAPATIVAIVKEARAKGVFVKTLVAAVALNNMACIFLFELARLVAHSGTGAREISPGEIVGGALGHLGTAALTGVVAAVGMTIVARLVRRPELLTTAGLIALMLTVGVAQYLECSPLLACLFLGLTQANVTRERSQVVDTLFANLEPAILAAFFTLAGMDLTLEHAGAVGLVALVFFSARVAGKLAAGDVAMRWAGATEKLRRNIGLALIPQAGVAVGLVLLLENDAVLRGRVPETLDLFVAVVLTVVVANEIAGPLLTRHALTRSGEVGHDRLRLIDFIHEEDIRIGLDSRTPEAAIRTLAGLLASTNGLEEERAREFLDSALRRERETSTCLGGGLMVPHGTLAGARTMTGVMGISPEGLPFETPDGIPVHCVVLLCTPDEDRVRHLQVLATLARTIGTDPAIQEQLFHAKSPAHAYEILHIEEAEDFNVFLEDLR